MLKQTTATDNLSQILYVQRQKSLVSQPFKDTLHGAAKHGAGEMVYDRVQSTVEVRYYNSHHETQT